MASRIRATLKEDRQTQSNAWMVTFGDLIMLLLTFFVLMFSMKTLDNHVVKNVFEKAIDAIDSFVYRKNLDPNKKYAKALRPVMIESKLMLQNRLGLVEGIDSLPSETPIYRKLKDIIEISKDDRGVVVTLDADHLFRSGESAIRDDRKFLLDATGRLLRYIANDILIMGHTDNVPIKSGPIKSNWELSFYRAYSVLSYLTVKVGLDADRFAVGGYGESRPRYPNNSDFNRSKNRRVEFVLRPARR